MEPATEQDGGGTRIKLRRRGLVVGSLGALAASLFGRTETARGSRSVPGVKGARSVTGPFAPAAFHGTDTGALGGYSQKKTAIYGISSPTTIAITLTTLFQQPTVGLMGMGTDEPTIPTYTLTRFGGVLGIGDDFGVAGGTGAPPPIVSSRDAGIVAWATDPQTPALWGYNPAGVGLCVDGALALSSANQARLRAGAKTQTVRDPDIDPKSLVFGQFGSNPGNNAYIVSLEASAGKVTVRLSQPTSRPTVLNYFAVQSKGG